MTTMAMGGEVQMMKELLCLVQPLAALQGYSGQAKCDNLWPGNRSFWPYDLVQMNMSIC